MDASSRPGHGNEPAQGHGQVKPQRGFGGQSALGSQGRCSFPIQPTPEARAQSETVDATRAIVRRTRTQNNELPRQQVPVLAHGRWSLFVTSPWVSAAVEEGAGRCGCHAPSVSRPRQWQRQGPYSGQAHTLPKHARSSALPSIVPGP